MVQKSNKNKKNKKNRFKAKIIWFK